MNGTLEKFLGIGGSPDQSHGTEAHNGGQQLGEVPGEEVGEVGLLQKLLSNFVDNSGMCGDM